MPTWAWKCGTCEHKFNRISEPDVCPTCGETSGFIERGELPMVRTTYQIGNVPEVGPSDNDTYQILVAFQRSLGDDSEYAGTAKGLVSQFCGELQGAMSEYGVPAGQFQVLSVTVPPDVPEGGKEDDPDAVFDTLPEAKAFKRGIEFVNDSSIRSVKIRAEGTKWAVTIKDAEK